MVPHVLRDELVGEDEHARLGEEVGVDVVRADHREDLAVHEVEHVDPTRPPAPPSGHRHEPRAGAMPGSGRTTPRAASRGLVTGRRQQANANPQTEEIEGHTFKGIGRV